MEDKTFKIAAVHGSREWTHRASGSKNIDYTIELEGLAGRHTLTQKPTTPAPTVGEELFGHPEDGGSFPSGDPKPPKFKKAQKDNGGRGGPRYTAEDIARMDAVGRVKGRCHAQAQALAYCAIRAAQGKLPDEFKMSDLKPIIDWFTDDAESAR